MNATENLRVLWRSHLEGREHQLSWFGEVRRTQAYAAARGCVARFLMPLHFRRNKERTPTSFPSCVLAQLTGRRGRSFRTAVACPNRMAGHITESWIASGTHMKTLSQTTPVWNFRTPDKGPTSFALTATQVNSSPISPDNTFVE